MADDGPAFSAWLKPDDYGSELMDGKSTTLQVVHCVDTEGPLINEPLSTTFARLREIFGIVVDETPESLAAIQTKAYPCGGREEEVYEVFKPEKLNFNETWDMVDEMLRRITLPAFRQTVTDSFGEGWIFSWHCIDHIGIRENPRGRDLTMHGVYDHYRHLIETWPGCQRDQINFHFHPIPYTRNAAHCATHYFAQGPDIYSAIAQRLIDRQFFPSVNRAGLHTIRPDSHWFLEQFIPFDISNQSVVEQETVQADMGRGRFGDWRRAPVTWAPYHPAHDDYQAVGVCNRWIGRCLNLGGRARALTLEDCELAFEEAREGKPAVLAFTNHDFRDMEPEIRLAHDMLSACKAKYPDVSFKYAASRDAMRDALGLHQGEPLTFTTTWDGATLLLEANKNSFGPQPFLAIKTKDGAYVHDNLDFQCPYRQWSYTFDENQYPLESVEKIGIGSCDSAGFATAMVIDVASGDTSTAII